MTLPRQPVRAEPPRSLEVSYDEASFTARYQSREATVRAPLLGITLGTFVVAGVGLVVLPGMWSWAAAVFGYLSLGVFLWALWSRARGWTWLSCSITELVWPTPMGRRQLLLMDLISVGPARTSTGWVLRVKSRDGTWDLEMTETEARWLAKRISEAYRQAHQRSRDWGSAGEVPAELQDLQDRP